MSFDSRLMGRALQPVPGFGDAERLGHVLQFAVAVAGTADAVERMVREIQLHHAPAERA